MDNIKFRKSIVLQTNTFRAAYGLIASRLAYLSAFSHLHRWYREPRSEFRHQPITLLSVAWSDVSSIQVCLSLRHGHHHTVVEFLFTS